MQVVVGVAMTLLGGVTAPAALAQATKVIPALPKQYAQWL